MNKAAFYKTVRARLGSLTQSQVDGFETLLDTLNGLPLAYQAYALATAWHETARTMQPIKERGGAAYFTKMYDITGARPELAAKHGNTLIGDGIRYCGRGYVQLTWRDNYRRAGQKLDVPLEAEPDLAMQSGIAAKILREGMWEGWFSGKRFASYLPAAGPATLEQYASARRIINGTDAASTIAGYALTFERALRDGGLV